LREALMSATCEAGGEGESQVGEESGSKAAVAELDRVAEGVARPSPGRRLRGFIPSLLAAALAVLLAYGIATGWSDWVGSAGPQWTDDAALAADVTPLSAQVAGHITAVLVSDFARVKAGQLLVQIDDAPYRAQLQQAQASIANAQAALTNLVAQQELQLANIGAAAAQMAGNQATEVRDEEESRRQRALLVTRIAGTEQAVEQADAAWKQSQAQVAQSAAALEAAHRQLDVLHTQEGQLAANLKGAEAARDLAAINLGYTRIVAPVDGMVGQRRVYPGQYVAIGTQVLSVVPLPNLYVIADYRETQLTHLRIGQPATIRVDTFPGAVLRGHVEGWSPATGSEFALLPPDNATGNFTKVVQRIPVRVAIDSDAGLGPALRPGMSVETTIDTSAAPVEGP
jgi:membrane fusion protein, multidrug efflux system